MRLRELGSQGSWVHSPTDSSGSESAHCMEPIHLLRRPTGNLLRLEGPMLAFVDGPGRQLLWARLADNG